MIGNPREISVDALPARRSLVKHPGTKVAVIGIGGLGHLALQFARAMGAEVGGSPGAQVKAE